MIDVVLLTLGLLGLIVGSITDIKTREVPDWVNYSLIGSGLGLRLLYSVSSFDFGYFLWGLAGFGIFFALAWIMYYTGQWGGGDSKMLMGMGALFGTYPEFLFKVFNPKLSHILLPEVLNNSLSFLLAFLVNLLFVGAIYGLFWSIGLSIKNRKKFMVDFKKRMKVKKVVVLRRVILILGLLILLSILFVTNAVYQVLALIGVFVALLTFYVWAYVKSVENVCMYKTVSATKVTEGDWIAEDVMHDGKKVYSANQLGIEKKDMLKLVKLKVKKVVVKEGIPFVPSFLVSFIISLTLGNLMFLMLKF